VRSVISVHHNASENRQACMRVHTRVYTEQHIRSGVKHFSTYYTGIQSAATSIDSAGSTPTKKAGCECDRCFFKLHRATERLASDLMFLYTKLQLLFLQAVLLMQLYQLLFSGEGKFACCAFICIVARCAQLAYRHSNFSFSG
jgi:hypothetical protein